MNKKLVILLLCLALTACAAPNVSDVWKVSNIVYAFDSFDPAKIATISFDLDHAVSSVSIKINDSLISKQCESAEPFIRWTCPVGSVTVSGDMSMRVIVRK
jgi:hypothetical protein